MKNTEEEVADVLHPSHETHVSMSASSYDEICIHCGAHDRATGGWGELAKPCSNPKGIRGTKEVT